MGGVGMAVRVTISVIRVRILEIRVSGVIMRHVVVGVGVGLISGVGVIIGMGYVSVIIDECCVSVIIPMRHIRMGIIMPVIVIFVSRVFFTDILVNNFITMRVLVRGVTMTVLMLGVGMTIGMCRVTVRVAVGVCVGIAMCVCVRTIAVTRRVSMRHIRVYHIRVYHIRVYHIRVYHIRVYRVCVSRV
jgi:hypothetical protein